MNNATIQYCSKIFAPTVGEYYTDSNVMYCRFSVLNLASTKRTHKVTRLHQKKKAAHDTKKKPRIGWLRDVLMRSIGRWTAASAPTT